MPAKKKTDKKKQTSPKRRSPVSYRLQATVAGLVLLTALLAVVALFYDSHPQFKERLYPDASETLRNLRDDVRIEVESLLLRSGFSLDAISDDLIAEMLVFKVKGDYPQADQIEAFERRLAKVSSVLLLVEAGDGEGFTVQCQGEIVCRVEFEADSITGTSSGTRIAIVMDDLGRDIATARSLLAIDLPVTFSILPGTARAARVATLAHLGNREVLIHLPMEPQGFPAVNPGDDALLLGQPGDEMRRRLRGYLERVPYAVGGNNHMGSRFTEDVGAMTAVLDFMQENSLFFVDSRTSGRSVGYRLALEKGMASASRDVFLDNVQKVEDIRDQFRKLVAQAKRTGHAIGICHPYPETLEALRLEVDGLAGSDVKVVPVSALLGRR